MKNWDRLNGLSLIFKLNFDMKFTINGRSFEIPDEWWQASGMLAYTLTESHYLSSSAKAIVPLEEIEPPLRDRGKMWFRGRDEVVSLLNGMLSYKEIPPIQVWSKEKNSSNLYVVRDGYHRFYLSVAVGYSKIPVEINDYDINEFLENEAKGRLCAI